MIVVRNGQIADAERGLIEGDIYVDNGKIVEILPRGGSVPEGAAIVNATDRILMPGLVNAHTHSHGNLVRSVGDKWTLELSMHLNAAIRRSQTLEDKYLGALIGAAEMVSKGCTACYDLVLETPFPTEEGLHAVAQAYSDVGMRAVIAPMMASHSFYDAIPGLRDWLSAQCGDQLPRRPGEADEVSLDVCRRTLHNWPFDTTKISMAVAPTVPLHCTDSFWRKAAAFAADYGVGVHTHLAESKLQAVAGLQRYGCSLTTHLDRLGILAPNLTVAHSIWVDAEDMARLSDNGVSIAHNPGSNMRLGSGLAAVRSMLDQGLNVGVGTDSRSCSDNLNMFEAMRLASHTSRVRGPDYTRWLASGEVLRMATVDSARALGLRNIGRIRPGYFADIVFLNRRHVNYVPLNDVINQIVNSEDGTAVTSVMIAGKMVLENGRFLTFDYDSLCERAERSVSRMRDANSDVLELARNLEGAVGSFCMALGSRPHHVHRFVDDTERYYSS